MELEDGSKVVTVHLNYAHIDEEHRRSGRLHELVDQVTKTSETAFSEKPVPVIVFLEQNDPLAMSRDDYKRDTEASGIDQVDRMHAWSRLGAKIVDFPYVQPELAPGKEPNDTLALAAITKGVDSIPPEVLKGHLHRFFGVSVAKGEGLAESAVDQMKQLDGMVAGKKDIALLDPSDAVTQLRTLDRDKLPVGSVREYVREHNAVNDNHKGVTLGTAEAMMDQVERQNMLVAKNQLGKGPIDDRGEVLTTRPEDARAGMFGGIRRMFAKATDPEIANRRAEIEADRSIEGRFAAQVAHRYVGKSMHEIARTIPEVWRDEGFPNDRDAAFVEIAKTARGIADRHMKSADRGLTGEHAIEGKRLALVHALKSDMDHESNAKSAIPVPLSLSLEMQWMNQAREIRDGLRPNTQPGMIEASRDRDAAPSMAPARGSAIGAHMARAAGRGM